MGTRGLIGFIIKGRRLGSYNHWDSYPSGLGNELMKFLMSLSEAQLKQFKAKLDDRRYAPFAKLDPSHAHYQHDHRPNDWGTLLHPVAHGRALPLILNGELSHLCDQTGFAEDGIFCEYAYFIDMERRVLVIDGITEEGVNIPFADFKEGLMCDLRAYGDDGEEAILAEMALNMREMAEVCSGALGTEIV